MIGKNVNPDTGAIIMELSDSDRKFLESLVVGAVNDIKKEMNSLAMLRPTPTQAPPAARTTVPSGSGPTNFPNYGRSKGAQIAGASRQDLDYYANGARKSIADPAKERFRANEQALLAAIDAEIARQSGGGSSAPIAPPPSGGPDDSDLPFALPELRLTHC